MLFTLNLSLPLTYKAEEHSIEEIYDLKPGSEFTYCCRFFYDDVFLRLEKKWCGYHAPYTQEEKDLVEGGYPPPQRQGYNLCIPAGKYSLLQTGVCEDEKEILSLVKTLPLSRIEGEIYIRFYKEKEFEAVMQIFLPL